MSKQRKARAKPTPGPWEVDGTVALGAYGVWTAYPHPQNPGHDGVGYPVQVCSVAVGDWRQGPIGQDERGANAALIAAAPDLRYALQAFVDYCAQAGIGDPTEADEYEGVNGFDGDAVFNYRQAVAALAKAAGEPTP